MHRFATLYESLDTTTSTNAKVDAMLSYFRSVDAADAAWAVYVLIGRRLKRSVGQSLLRGWLLEEAQLPAWLIDETYASVGDLAETIALLVPPAEQAAPTDQLSLHAWFDERILPLTSQDVAEKRAAIVGWWRSLPYRECFLVNKLLTGALRVGVSRSLVTRALAEASGRPRVDIERALIGAWDPSPRFWASLMRMPKDPGTGGDASTDALADAAHAAAEAAADAAADAAQPYPFYLASPFDGDPADLGERAAWLAEWKWDGIRGQVVRRSGHCTLWSRGEEIVSDRFPEIIGAAAALPDGTVLDGEVLAWRDGEIMSFAALQQRIGRRKLTPKILSEIPAHFVAYDLLEYGGEDWRPRPLRERRERLSAVVTTLARDVIGLSPAVDAMTWESLAALREQARTRGVEGLMLKAWDSPYGNGRQRGAWWKWKIDPFVFDGVLLYAAPGHGRRSNLYTDYTFGVWKDDALVPVAKAYSGLTDVEIQKLDRWIRTHTLERFGIVRSVEPVHVFELAFEGIASSSRHKSGIAMRFPRIKQWRTDKPPAEADTLANLQQLLAEQRRHAGG